MSTVVEDWKAQARELREAGLSEREIAKSVGKANSTVHSFLKSENIEPGGADDVIDVDVAEPEPEPPAPHPDPDLSPFRVERQQMEEQARIGDSGTVEWESESVYVPLSEIRVDGTAQLSMFDVGGKRATDSSLKLQGGRVMLADGQAFRKGDVVRLEVTAVVREVAQRDKPDPATGIVVSAEQKHVAYITDLRVLS